MEARIVVHSMLHIMLILVLCECCTGSLFIFRRCIVVIGVFNVQ